LGQVAHRWIDVELHRRLRVADSEAMRFYKSMLTGFATMFAAYALTTNSVMGYPADYGPFAPGQSPPHFSLRACPLLAEEGPAVVGGRQVMIYSDQRAASPRLRTRSADLFSGIQVEVLDSQQHSLAGPIQVSDFPAHSRPDSAWCADLNGDRALDFVLPLWGHGNGLGSLFYELVIVLSSGSRYRIWVVPTAEPGPEDFLVLRPPAGCVIVKTSFRSNEEQAESRRHSYWIYNLIVVRNDELVVANQFDRRFPKWVWYIAGPNHKPTASLSLADKERIWGLQQESLFREATSVNR
jgi:hypothetical protein